MRKKITAAFVLGLACAGPQDAPTVDANTAPDPTAGRGAIVFLGTSLTAGYGVGSDSAYPAIIQTMIDSAGLPFRVVNAGLSGETSAGGLRRLEWSLQEPVDILFLELGANDGLRGLDPVLMSDNLDAILTRTRHRYPDAGLVIAGMEAPPNLGPEYTRAFRAVFAELAERHDATLIPFLLEGVGGQPALNQADRIHPNAAGHRLIARTVWPLLEPMLRQRALNETRVSWFLRYGIPRGPVEMVSKTRG